MHNQENQERLNFTNNVRNLSRYSEQGLKRSGKRYNNNKQKDIFYQANAKHDSSNGIKKIIVFKFNTNLLHKSQSNVFQAKF